MILDGSWLRIVALVCMALSMGSVLYNVYKTQKEDQYEEVADRAQFHLEEMRDSLLQSQQKNTELISRMKEAEQLARNLRERMITQPIMPNETIIQISPIPPDWNAPVPTVIRNTGDCIPRVTPQYYKCEYCGTVNHEIHGSCVKCGAPL